MYMVYIRSSLPDDEGRLVFWDDFPSKEEAEAAINKFCNDSNKKYRIEDFYTICINPDSNT